MIGKYITEAVKLMLMNLQLLFTKLTHFQNIYYNPLQRIHPTTTIELNKGSKLVILKMVKIDKYCCIKVRKNSEVMIGKKVGINRGCNIVCHEKIIIGEGTMLGPNVMLFDHDHDFKAPGGIKELKYKTGPIIIGENVWIGANVVILRGTEIGNNCIIGAGCVLKGKYQSNTIVTQVRETNKISY